ncbi:hypothetical protein MGR01S_23750 [Meiothermus granaticius NBRC 107808]|uniref:Uncharacterized protein n=1 Tax=Meiothermus granaticius NBRC 107808 TaxID=1227551 RepID=A0A399F7P9_9DEIN|nr:hypothetical protein Mgrana_01359 [Meiothermus granaticius NBRC 107808]GEM87750.1 hypothetical protein MGR01S_23750 [Meiothermus granaticius NBRC 107808]
MLYPGCKALPGHDHQRVSKTITTHKYEPEVLAKAFSGIKVKHDLIQEGDVKQHGPSGQIMGRLIKPVALRVG